MNKGVVIAIVAVFVLGLGGVGAYKMMGNKKSTEATVTTETETSVSQPKSLKDLITGGLTQKCSYAGGDLYMGSGKVRTDANGTHMLMEGNTAYMWTDGQTQGMKMQFDLSKTEAGTTATAESKVDWEKPTNYNCGPWVANDEMFELPVEIEFTDYSAMMAPSGGVDKCAACATLTGENKTACMNVLGCK